MRKIRPIVSKLLAAVLAMLLLLSLFAGCRITIVDPTQPQLSASDPTEGQETQAPQDSEPTATNPDANDPEPVPSDPGDPEQTPSRPENDSDSKPVESETAPPSSEATDPTEPDITEPDITEPEETEPVTEPEDTKPDPTDPPTEESTQTPTEPPTEGNTSHSFQIHFLDVGQADSALVLCGNEAMLIDGGNVADSSLLYSHLKSQGITHLDYVVATHAHEDHVGGLSGALNYASVDTVYCPVTSYNSNAFNNFVKAANKHGASITVPKVGHTFNLGSAKVQIVACNPNASDPNESSIMLRIVYGSTSFMFTGDGESEAESAALNSGYTLKSDVLKVGHHGSRTSTSYAFLRAVAPDHAVISVGYGNSYGHPTETVLSRLRDADAKVYRTDMQGTVIATSDGKTVKIRVTRNADADTLGPASPSTTEPPVIPTEPEDGGENTSEKIVDSIFALGNGQEYSEPVTLTGKVVSVEEISTQFKNATFTIQVQGSNGTKNLYCFRCNVKDGQPLTIEVGDTVTLFGTVKNYYGTIEYCYATFTVH